jgi:hypothetical protein
MPENIVVFHIGGQPWTLGGVCVALSVLCLAVWACLLPYFASRYGTVRAMTTEEAQRRVFIGTDSTSLTGEVVAGPAAGKKREVEFTIGGLRGLRERGDSLWFLLPAYAELIVVAMFLFGVGLALLTRAWIFLAFSGAAVLIGSIFAFCRPSALSHSRLERSSSFMSIAMLSSTSCAAGVARRGGAHDPRRIHTALRAPGGPQVLGRRRALALRFFGCTSFLDRFVRPVAR